MREREMADLRKFYCETNRKWFGYPEGNFLSFLRAFSSDYGRPTNIYSRLTLLFTVCGCLVDYLPPLIGTFSSRAFCYCFIFSLSWRSVSDNGQWISIVSSEFESLWTWAMAILYINYFITASSRQSFNIWAAFSTHAHLETALRCGGQPLALARKRPEVTVRHVEWCRRQAFFFQSKCAIFCVRSVLYCIGCSFYHSLFFLFFFFFRLASVPRKNL